MKKHSFFLCFLFTNLLLFFSCQDCDVLENNIMESNAILTSNEEHDSCFVDKTLAMRVAIKQISPNTRTALEVDNIITLSDTQDEPAIYAINYKNNAGYILVSATKNYSPVLARIETGKFDFSNLPEPMQWYIESYKSDIMKLRKAPYDSVRTYHQEWKLYDNQKTHTTTKSLSSLPLDLQRYIQDCCDEWSSKGYEYSSVAVNGLNLPENLYTQALAIAEMTLREDYLETSFVVRMTDVINKQVDPMLTTTWGQSSPYNMAIVDRFGPNCLTGCVTVAMAQIMNYHKKPTTYDWNNMENNYWNIANLMLDVGLAAKINYANNSGTSPQNALSAFKSFGYTNARLISHDQFTVRSQILSYKPVYMRGSMQGSNIGHAWVCDGIKDYTYRDIYCVMYLLLSGELNFKSYELKVENEWATRTFHMNWGWESEGDGWFFDNNIEVQSYNFNINRQDIVDIK